MERNHEVPASTRDAALFIPETMPKESRGAPRNAKGNLTSLTRHEQSPRSTCNWRGTLSFPPQLHTNYEILPCTLEEVILCCSVSKESPHFPWISKVSLTRYMKLQKYPRYRLHSRGTLSFPPQVKKSRVSPASIRDEGRSPCFTSNGMPTSPSHLVRSLISTWHWSRNQGPCHDLKGTYYPSTRDQA